jgi:hypothetical protein
MFVRDLRGILRSRDSTSRVEPLERYSSVMLTDLGSSQIHSPRPRVAPPSPRCFDSIRRARFARFKVGFEIPASFACLKTLTEETAPSARTSLRNRIASPTELRSASLPPSRPVISANASSAVLSISSKFPFDGRGLDSARRHLLNLAICQPRPGRADIRLHWNEQHPLGALLTNHQEDHASRRDERH